MRSVTRIIFLVSVAKVHCHKLEDASAQELYDKFVDRLMGSLYETSLLHHADLDDTTLEKPSHLATPTARLSAVSALPRSIAHLPRPIPSASQFRPGYRQALVDFPNRLTQKWQQPMLMVTPVQAATLEAEAPTSIKADEKANIISIIAREVIDSRGNPTVEAELTTGYGTISAIVPSGASTGAYEALELRDGGDRYKGKGVEKAIANIHNVIAPQLKGKDVRFQQELDTFMTEQLDGSQNEWGWVKSKLGANAILAVSMCIARAGAQAFGLELYEYVSELKETGGEPGAVDPARAKAKKYKMPVPMMNVINGGVHAGNMLPMQEFMIAPIGAKTFKQAMQMGSEVYSSLQKVVKKKYGKDAVAVGDEGGFAPNIQDTDSATAASECLMDAIKDAGHSSEVKLAMDVAASEFYNKADGTYNLGFKADNPPAELIKSRSEMIDFYKGIVQKFPLVSIEDPFDEDDWGAWTELVESVGSDVQIVGDDLLVTNCKRIEVCKEKKAANAMLLKVNQIGTVTESIKASKESTAEGWGVMVSHRSGETEDTFIADLCVGLGTGQLKSGAPCRSERVAKYNRLLRIEEKLGDKASFAGTDFRKS